MYESETRMCLNFRCLPPPRDTSMVPWLSSPIGVGGNASPHGVFGRMTGVELPLCPRPKSCCSRRRRYRPVLAAMEAAINSASVVLVETAVCFLESHRMGHPYNQ